MENIPDMQNLTKRCSVTSDQEENFCVSTAGRTGHVIMSVSWDIYEIEGIVRGKE